MFRSNQEINRSLSLQIWLFRCCKQLIDHKLAKKYPNATLTVSVLGWCKTYETVRGELMHYNVQGCVFNDAKRHIYVPAPQLGNIGLLGLIETWEGDRK